MQKPNKPIERPASLDRFEVKKSKHDLLREKWRAEREYLVTLPLPNLAEKAKWTNAVPKPLREEKRPIAAPQNDLLMADWGK